MEKKLKNVQIELYKYLSKYNNDDSVDVLKLSQQICYLIIGCECFFKCDIRGDRIFWAYHQIEHYFDPTFKQMDEIIGFLNVTQNKISEILNNTFN